MKVMDGSKMWLYVFEEQFEKNNTDQLLQIKHILVSLVPAYSGGARGT